MVFQSKSFKAQTIFVITMIITILCLLIITSLFFETESYSRTMQKRGIVIFSRLIIIVVVFGFVARHIITWIDISMSKVYNYKRLIVEFLIIVLISIFLGGIVFYTLPTYASNDSGPPIHPIAKITLLNIFIGVVVFSIYEVWMNIERNNDLQTSLAKLEKEQLSLKLTAIQQKLNPHFMFNSLNVLSELVHEDSNKADTFIHQFSKVYRYVLELNNDSFVPLSQELEFMKSYQYLLEIRLGKSLIISDNIEVSVLSKMVPPLSLQLLLENAIKHNKASKEHPLIIQLENSNDSLIISNNLQERVDQSNNLGLGLQKLKETYSLMGERLPKFEKIGESFRAELPLITNDI